MTNSPHDVDAIETGNRSYVIGRKGTGKTAIGEYLVSRVDPLWFARKLTFKNYPFNDLYSLSNDRYTPPNQYITLWKYVIYSCVAQMMSENQALPASLRANLAKAYSHAPGDTLQKTIRKWTNRSFGFSILGTGASVGPVQSQTTDLPWIERVEVLEAMILTNLNDATYLVVFDELDEDYKNFSNSTAAVQYSALITSLFKAVQDIRAVSGAQDPRILPVLFLRDDIFDTLNDPDKTKWSDLTLFLDWTTDKIRQLLAFRLSRAFDPIGLARPFEDAWSLLFSPSPMDFATDRDMSLFSYITSCTYVRPRDYIRYLHDCAAAALDHGVKIIGPGIVKQAEKSFSEYLRSELIDEAREVLPDIAEVLNVINLVGKRHFRAFEFETVLNKAVDSGQMQTRDWRYCLEVLYRFSVIGNQLRDNRYMFRHVSKSARPNYDAAFVVHRGLLRCLQLN